MPARFDTFLQEATAFATEVDQYILDHRYIPTIEPIEVRNGAVAYLRHGGKRLRPFLVRTCCELVGGDPDIALPAAAAVEAFHMWTLVHDDIIDRDELRRGHKTLHLHYADSFQQEQALSQRHASHYGLSLSLLTGDVQQGLAVTLLCDLADSQEPALVLALVQEMMGPLIVNVMKGEVLDVQFAFLTRRKPSLDQLLEMIAGKTSALLEFCALAGASIGLGSYAPDASPTRELTSFARNCGLAFQLHDDLLSLTGNPETTGKPLGSDLREGKYTPIVHFALERAEGSTRGRILESLGEPDISAQDVVEIAAIFEKLGALDRTRELAREKLRLAFQALDQLPASDAKETLRTWAEFILNRQS